VNPQLFRLIAGQIFLHSTLAGSRMAAPLWALGAGYSPAAVGVLLALFGASQMLLAVPVGRYVDRHGMKRAILCSVFAACLGGLMAMIWPLFGVLCATALLIGGATAATVIAIQRQVGRLSTGGADLRRSFSWLAIGPSISNVIGPLAVGFLIDHAGPSPGSQQGFQAAFALMAAMPLVTWWLLRRVLRASQVTEAAQLAPQTPLRQTLQLLRHPGIARLMLVNWLISSSWDVHSLVVPFIGVARGLSASEIGMILGAFALATGLVRLLLPLMAERIREWAVISGSMLINGALFVLYPLLPSALAMGLCSFLMGVALGVVQPMVMSMLHQITPVERQGEALGLRLMAVTATGVAVPLLFGSVSALVGFSGVCWLIAAVLASGVRPAWRLREIQTPAAHLEGAGPPQPPR
jgi:MFS family permease